MFIALFESRFFFRRTFYRFQMATVCRNIGFPCHHDVVELIVRNIRSGRPTERFSAHSGCDHFDRYVSRTLERRAASQSDDICTAFYDFLLYLGPLLFRERICSDKLGKRFSVYFRRRGKHGHLLAVSAIGTTIFDGIHRYVEILSQFTAQASRVEGRQCRNLRRFQSRMQKYDKTGNIGRIEDDDDMFYVGTIFLYVLSELFGYGGIPFQKVFAGHTGFTGCATRIDDVLGIGKSLLDVGRISDVYTLEAAMIQFFGYTFQPRGIGVVQADIRCQVHHNGCLCHVGADHAGSTHNSEFFVRYKFHSLYF